MPAGMSPEQERANATDASMAPPTGTPNVGEVKPEGVIEQAKANVQIAMSMLEQSLPLLGGDSDEGKAVHKALGNLYSKFAGKKSQDLAPAELMSLISGMPDQYKDQMMMKQGGAMAPGAGPAGPNIPAIAP